MYQIYTQKQKDGILQCYLSGESVPDITGSNV